MNDAFANGGPPGKMPPAPESLATILTALEQKHAEFRAYVEGLSEETLAQPVKFFTGPGKIDDWPRIQFLWFMLCDEIHHRGQFSIYLRMADGKVPSIYGPSGDEPWM
jgi:uncharacterized damage-inducible protein DinB